MAEQRTTHLRVVRPMRTTTTAARERSRTDYWAQVQALHDQRQRLRAG